MVRTLCFFGLLLGAVAQAFAVDPVVNGVYKIDRPDGGSGTGFIVKQTGNKVYLATAFHVLQDEKSPVKRGIFTSYKIFNDEDALVYGTVLAADEDADIAIFTATTDRPHTVVELYTEPLPEINQEYIPAKKPIEVIFEGYGYGKWTKTSGNLVHKHRGHVYSDGILFQGSPADRQRSTDGAWV